MLSKDEKKIWTVPELLEDGTDNMFLVRKNIADPGGFLSEFCRVLKKKKKAWHLSCKTPLKWEEWTTPLAHSERSAPPSLQSHAETLQEN